MQALDFICLFFGTLNCGLALSKKNWMAATGWFNFVLTYAAFAVKW